MVKRRHQSHQTTQQRRRSRLATIESLQRRELLAADTFLLNDAPVQVRLAETDADFAPIRFTVDRLKPTHSLSVINSLQLPSLYTGPRLLTAVSATETDSVVHVDTTGKSVSYTLGSTNAPDSFSFTIDGLYTGIVYVETLQPLIPDHYEVLSNAPPLAMHLIENDFLPRVGESPWGVASPTEGAAVKATARITGLVDVDPAEFQISEDGQSVYFTSASEQTGLREFRYVINDRYEQSASVLVHQGVYDDQFEVDRHAPSVEFDVLANDLFRSRFSGNSVQSVNRITSVVQGDHGGVVEITANGSKILYTPPLDYIGIETFQYTADDRHTATVNVRLRSLTTNDHISVYLGESTLLDVLANDFVVSQPGSKSITAISPSIFGAKITIEGDKLRYTVPDNAVIDRTDRFTYTINDEFTASVNVTFLSPTRIDYVSVERPTELVVDVLGNDRFDQDYTGPRVITNVTTASGGGQVSISDDGSHLLFTPGSENETFTYTVDHRYTESVIARPAPHLQGESVFVAQNEPEWIIDVLANDFQPDYQGLPNPYFGPKVLSIDPQSTQGGMINVTDDDRIRYVPPADFFGTDSFEYRIDEFLTQTVTVNVFRSTADDTFTVNIGSQANELEVLANDIFGPDYGGERVITSVEDSSSLMVEISPDGRSLIYSAPHGFRGQHAFTYVVDDQFTATVSVNVGQSPQQALTETETPDNLRQSILEKVIQERQNDFGQQIDASASQLGGFELCDSGNNFGQPGFAPFHEFQSSNRADDRSTPQMVEFDGQFFYSLRDGVLAITERLANGELAVKSQTPVLGQPRGMFLHGNRLTVVSLSDPGEFTGGPCGSVGDGSPANTMATVYDVTNRTNPRFVQRTLLGGQFIQAKKVGDELAFVIKSAWNPIELATICDEQAQCRKETEAEFTTRLNENFSALVQENLPKFQTFNHKGALLRSGTLLGDTDFFTSEITSGSFDSITLISKLDPHSNEPGLSGAVGVLSNAQTGQYLSHDSLYLFQGPDPATEPTGETTIRKYRWTNDASVVDLVASGSVPGRVNVDASVDEYQDRLRVVSENLTPIQGTPLYHAAPSLFVLEEHAGALATTGFVHEIGLNQSFDRVQFDADRAFIVPNKYDEQLIAIDLSDPRMPTSLGAMELVDDVSRVQFLSEDRLLIVSGAEFSFSTYPAMLSLYDVSDLSNPVLLGNYGSSFFGGVGEENNAFAWNPVKNILVAPLGQSDRGKVDVDGDGYPEADRFYGSKNLAIFDVDLTPEDSNPFTAIGTVTHDDFLQRSLFVGDSIYSIARDGIQATSIDGADAVSLGVRFGDTPELQTVARDSLQTHPLVNTARAWLRETEGVATGPLWLVGFEQRGDRIEMVFRTGSNRYRVSARASGELQFQVSEFQVSPNPHHNGTTPMDVNGDQKVTPSDALQIINLLARGGVENLTDRAFQQIFPLSGAFADVNNDGMITPRDVLAVINDIARTQARSPASAEQVPFERLHNTDDHDWSTRDEALATLF